MNPHEVTSKLQEIVTELRFLVNAVDKEVSSMKLQIKDDINELKKDISEVEKKLDEYQNENKNLPFQVKLIWGAMIMVIGVLMGAILSEIGATYIHKSSPNNSVIPPVVAPSSNKR